MSKENFYKDLERCIDSWWTEIPEEIQDEIDKVYEKYSKEEDEEISKEFEKLDRILEKEREEWEKCQESQGDWFELEHDIMTGHGYHYTENAEWTKRVNGKIYHFGQF
jgi:TRAP-type C4-dicarboxylate transport system substrate-binding protein